MIVGHKSVRDRLRLAIDKRQNAHAYSFVGPESVGKFAVALEFSERFIGAARNMSNTIVLAPQHIEEKGKVKVVPIGIETVRDAIRTIGLSNASGCRALIIDDAERLTESAQNALLKTLEEPPEKMIIILVSHNEGSILPTVQSRCVRVPFSFVSEAEIRQAFPDAPPVTWLLGRPGIAKLASKESQAFLEDLSVLDRLTGFHSISYVDRFAILDSISGDISRAERILSWWIGVLQGRIAGNGESELGRASIIRLISSISSTLRDIRKSPGSARILLETLLYFGKSTSQLFPRLFSRLL